MHEHGAHDQAVEHQAHQGPGLAQQVAIFTALLSTIGAVVAYKMNENSEHALHPLHKLEQALRLIQIAIALGGNRQ